MYFKVLAQIKLKKSHIHTQREMIGKDKKKLVHSNVEC